MLPNYITLLHVDYIFKENSYFKINNIFLYCLTISQTTVQIYTTTKNEKNNYKTNNN